MKAQSTLLDELAGDRWWVDVTLPLLELTRRRVRSLVRFVEKTKRAVVYSTSPTSSAGGTLAPAARRRTNRRVGYAASGMVAAGGSSEGPSGGFSHVPPS